MPSPQIAYGTPRKLPNANSLEGRVVVLDIAFASEAGGVSFKKVTGRFIDRLGDRLAMWIDHHDHDKHADYADDPRFILATKQEHGACPEMVTPERVKAAGHVDTIVCHTDFDGLCSAAKWLRGGIEPYPGADADAHAVDTRLGTPSPRAMTMDRALRARPKDAGLRGIIIQFLRGGGEDTGLYRVIEEAADELKVVEAETHRLAGGYTIDGDVAVCDARQRLGLYDKTLLLLIGQERARVSVVHDSSAVTIAARFDSGVNLVELFGLSGGMPTRVSLAANELPSVLRKLQTLP